MKIKELINIIYSGYFRSIKETKNAGTLNNLHWELIDSNRVSDDLTIDTYEVLCDNGSVIVRGAGITPDNWTNYSIGYVIANIKP